MICIAVIDRVPSTAVTAVPYRTELQKKSKILKGVNIIISIPGFLNKYVTAKSSAKRLG